MELSMQKVFGCVPVTSGELKPELGRYRAPQARLALLRKRGELIPLRRNLYLCNPESYSPELIANRLIEPSYLSYETVLSACGIIPERVYCIRSSCLKRGRSFDNATGHYEYIRVPRAYYPEGVTIRKTEQGLCYLSATPEKALCDLIHNLALLSDKKKDSLFNLERMLRREFPCCRDGGGDEGGRSSR